MDFALSRPVTKAWRSCRLTHLPPLLIGFVLACGEEPTAPVVSDDMSDLAAASTAAALAFYQVSAGEVHTCGVTTDNRGYCWGFNGSAQLGDGTTTDHSKPVATAGGLRFRQVSAGQTYTCAVTTGFRAYCWGANGFGQLGDGTKGTNRLTPVPVAGGRQFRQVETNRWHTCGVSYPESRVYCWGRNSNGELGDGTTTDRPMPVLVGSGLRFRQVSAGVAHTCGVTTDDRAFCWGFNRYGQIGDRSEVARRLRPTLVADGHRFRQLDAGAYHNCAVTTDNRAFCWGNGRGGENGNGKAYLSFWPKPVSGGLRFDRVTAGAGHTCGESTLNQAYCWGGNSSGQLGDGTTTMRLTPVPVAGGLHFAQLSAGSVHSCGKNSEGKGYCWGYNFFGQLGDGTTTDRSRPVAVAGPM